MAGKYERSANHPLYPHPQGLGLHKQSPPARANFIRSNRPYMILQVNCESHKSSVEPVPTEPGNTHNR
jgi:hypothetical protein